MGFLNKGRRSAYHGGGNNNPALTVFPSSAVSTTGVFTPTVITTPGSSQKVTPLAAVSSSIARTPTILNGSIPSLGANDWEQRNSASGLQSATNLAQMTPGYYAPSSGNYGFSSDGNADGSNIKMPIGSFNKWAQTTLTTALVSGVSGQSFSVADAVLDSSTGAGQVLVFGPQTNERANGGQWTANSTTTATFTSYVPPKNYPIGTVVSIAADAQVTLIDNLYVPLKHAFIRTKMYHGNINGLTADLGGVQPRGIPPAFPGDNSNNTFFNTDDTTFSGVKRNMIIRSTTFARSYFIFYSDAIDAVHPFHFACDGGNWNYQCLPNPGIKPDQLWGQVEDRVIEWQPSSQGTTYASGGMSPDTTSDGILRVWINGFQIFNITNGRWGAEKMVAFQGPTTWRSPKYATTEVYQLYPQVWELGQIPGVVSSAGAIAANTSTGDMTFQLIVPSTDASGVATSIKVQRFVAGAFQDYVTINLATTPATDNRITGRQNVTITGLPLGNTERLQFAQVNALGTSAYGGDITFTVGALTFTGPSAASLHPYQPASISYGSDFSTYTTTAQINADAKFKSPNFIAANTNLALDNSVKYNGNNSLKVTTNESITWDWHLTGALPSVVAYSRFRHFPFTLQSGRRKIWVLNYDDGVAGSASVFTNSYGSNTFSFEFLNRVFTPISTVTKKGGAAVATNSWSPAAANLNLGTNFSQDGSHAYEFAVKTVQITATSNGGIQFLCYMRRDDSSIWKYIGTQTVQDPTFNTVTNPINIKVANYDNQDASGTLQRWLFDVLINDVSSNPADFDFSTAVNYTPY